MVKKQVHANLSHLLNEKGGKSMEGRKLNRRDFLRLSAALATGAVMVACAPATPKVVEVEKEVPVEKEVVRTVVVEKEKVVEKTVSPVEAERKRWLTGKVPPDITGTFKMMSWEDEGEMRKFLLHIERFFTTFYPKMKYEIEWGIPWSEYWTKLPTLMASGTPPDMAWQHQSRGKVFPAKGWSICLDDYIAQWPPDGWPDDWAKASVSTMSYKGKVYALPYDWCGRGFFVNRDILDPIVGDYPVPDDWTWDDLKELAIKATHEAPEGKVFGTTYWWNPMWFWGLAKGFGGRFFNDDITESRLNDPKTIEAAQWLWDMLWKHKVIPTSGQLDAIGGAATMFASQRLAMRATINDEAFRMDELVGGKFRWGVYPLPVGPGGRYCFEGNSGWFIPTGSKYPDLAYELMRYCLSNPELLPTTAVLGSAFVGRKSFWKWGMPPSRVLKDAPNYAHVFIDLATEKEVAFPWWPGYQEWEAIWTKWTDPIFVEGDPDVKGAFEGLHKETNEFLATGWWLET